MNGKKTWLALCLAAGSLGALGSAHADVYVRVAPPAPRYEVVPALPSGWVWVPGYWNWNGHRYVWVRGHRVHGRHGEHWVGHRWHRDHGRWRMERGHWDRD
ncbi:MAG: hypothetical protein ACM3JC_15690 [Rudaea sp.]